MSSDAERFLFYRSRDISKQNNSFLFTSFFNFCSLFMIILTQQFGASSSTAVCVPSKRSGVAVPLRGSDLHTAGSVGTRTASPRGPVVELFFWICNFRLLFTIQTTKKNLQPELKRPFWCQMHKKNNCLFTQRQKCAFVSSHLGSFFLTNRNRGVELEARTRLFI